MAPKKRRADEQQNGKATARSLEKTTKNTAEIPDPVFFFGADNENGYLSNMFLSEFESDGEVYVCVEQFFQAAKAALFGDESVRRSIMNTTDPKKHKSLGRKVKEYDDVAWQKAAEGVMAKALHFKFSGDSEDAKYLREKLVATRPRPLVETAGAKDKKWGCGLTKQQATKHIKEWTGKWPGKNKLGELLEIERHRQYNAKMDEEYRAKLMSEEEKDREEAREEELEKARAGKKRKRAKQDTDENEI